MKVSMDLKLFAVSLGCAAFVAVAPAAHAGYSEDWYSEANPLTAWEDGRAQGLAYGTAYQKDGYVKNHSYRKDPRTGGDGVYTQTDYSYLRYSATCDCHRWSAQAYADQSSRSDSGLWREEYDRDDYTERDHEGKVRLHYKVCEDQPWSPDACSRNPYVLFDSI